MNKMGKKEGMTMLLILITACCVLVVGIAAVLIVFHIKMSKFKPTKDKKKQLQEINNDLRPTGFAYSPNGDYFYSLRNCWQRNVGYCKFYDDGAAFLNMIIHCEPIKFSYGGKKWLIEFWKGQYGITTGAEVGVYNTSKGDVHTNNFSGTCYGKINNDEQLPISFVLKKNKSVILKRKDIHWWLTGFKLGEYSKRSSLSMKIKIKFPNQEMCQAFTDGLEEIGYTKKEYSVFKTTVKINYTKPHSTQSNFQQGPQAALVQQTNRSYCEAFNMATIKYKYTADKLEYIKASVPVLYDMFISSIYGKKFYEQVKGLGLTTDVKFEYEKQQNNNHSCGENCLCSCIRNCLCFPGGYSVEDIFKFSQQFSQQMKSNNADKEFNRKNNAN